MDSLVISMTLKQFSTVEPDGGWLTLTQRFEKIVGVMFTFWTLFHGRAVRTSVQKVTLTTNHSGKGKFIHVSTTRQFKVFYTQKSIKISTFANKISTSCSLNKEKNYFFLMKQIRNMNKQYNITFLNILQLFLAFFCDLRFGTDLKFYRSLCWLSR